MESDSDFDKLFRETFKGMEDLFKEHPEQLEIYRTLLRKQFSAYAGESEDEYPPLSEQETKTDKEKLRRVTKDSYPECIPLSEKRVKIDFPHQYSEEEFQRMIYGLAPASMDEKWIVIVEDLVIRFYRSWVPNRCIYEIQLERLNDVFKVKETLVDAAFLEETWNSPDYAAGLLHYIVQRMLLGRSLPFPFPDSISNTMEKNMFRHGLVGSSIANDER